MSIILLVSVFLPDADLESLWKRIQTCEIQISEGKLGKVSSVSSALTAATQGYDSSVRLRREIGLVNKQDEKEKVSSLLAYLLPLYDVAFDWLRSLVALSPPFHLCQTLCNGSSLLFVKPS